MRMRDMVIIAGGVAGVGAAVLVGALLWATGRHKQPHSYAPPPVASRRVDVYRQMSPEQRHVEAIRIARADRDRWATGSQESLDLIGAVGGTPEARDLAGVYGVHLMAGFPAPPNELALMLQNSTAKHVRELPQTQVPEAVKDPVGTRGRWCDVTGRVVSIRKQGSIFEGLMMTDTSVIWFFTPGPTDGIFDGSTATFTGIVAAPHMTSVAFVGFFKI